MAVIHYTEPREYNADWMAGQYIFHSPLYHLSAQSSFWSHIIINNLDIGVVALRGNLGSEIFVVGLIQFWHYTDE